MKKKEYKKIADVSAADEFIGEIGIEVLECKGPAYESDEQKVRKR